MFPRRLTISDGIERSLKKGRGAEQASAATLAAIVCIQLGVGDMTDQVCHDLHPLLTFLANDNSVTPLARGKVSNSRAISSIINIDKTRKFTLYNTISINIM